MRRRRYEILLPLTHNEGRQVNPDQSDRDRRPSGCLSKYHAKPLRKRCKTLLANLLQTFHICSFRDGFTEFRAVPAVFQLCDALQEGLGTMFRLAALLRQGFDIYPTG